jgi:hypothetical protein
MRRVVVDRRRYPEWHEDAGLADDRPGVSTISPQHAGAHQRHGTIEACVASKKPGFAKTAVDEIPPTSSRTSSGCFVSAANAAKLISTSKQPNTSCAAQFARLAIFGNI